MNKNILLLLGLVALSSVIAGCSGETPVASGPAKSAKAPNTKNWSATLNKMPPGPTSLAVTGEVETTMGGTTVTLSKKVPQGTNPTILLLDLTVKQPEVGTAVMGWAKPRFDEKPAAAEYKEVHVMYDSAVIEKIKVSEAH